MSTPLLVATGALNTLSIAPAYLGSISAEDWELLQKCVLNPKVSTPGGEIEGFGYIPQLTRKIVSFIEAILQAEEK